MFIFLGGGIVILLKSITRRCAAIKIEAVTGEGPGYQKAPFCSRTTVEIHEKS